MGFVIKPVVESKIFFGMAIDESQNRYIFKFHCFSVNNPAFKRRFERCASTIQNQCLPDVSGTVVFVYVPTQPEFWLGGFNPASDGATTAMLSIVQEIAYTEWWSMSQYNSVAVCMDFAEFVRQFVVVRFPVGHKWCR